jgi:hypothetical protein
MYSERENKMVLVGLSEGTTRGGRGKENVKRGKIAPQCMNTT